MNIDISNELLNFVEYIDDCISRLKRYFKIVIFVSVLAIILSLILGNLIVFALTFVCTVLLVTFSMIEVFRIQAKTLYLIKQTHSKELQEYRNGNIWIGVSNNYLSFFMKTFDFQDEEYIQLKTSYISYQRTMLVTMFGMFIVFTGSFICTFILSVILGY